MRIPTIHQVTWKIAGLGGKENTDQSAVTSLCSHSFSPLLKGEIKQSSYLSRELKIACLKLKDGACFCYCPYALRISRYSGFLWVVPTNTGIFLCGLKLCGESRT